MRGRGTRLRFKGASVVGGAPCEMVGTRGERELLFSRSEKSNGKRRKLVNRGQPSHSDEQRVKMRGKRGESWSRVREQQAGTNTGPLSQRCYASHTTTHRHTKGKPRNPTLPESPDARSSRGSHHSASRLLPDRINLFSLPPTEKEIPSAHLRLPRRRSRR